MERSTIVRKIGRADSPTPPVEPPGVREAPLSTSQERIWFLGRLDPASRAYHFQATLAFDGQLDIEALRRALGAVVARHETFRTTFHDETGQPVQRVHPEMRVELPLVDLSSAESAELDAELARAIDDQIAKPFALDRLPLVRWTLVRLRADRHVLIHVEHHLVHDGWSFYIFLDELFSNYRAMLAGGLPTAEPLPLQFADYAIWERGLATSGKLDADLAFWESTLADLPPAVALATDRSRSAAHAYIGTTIRRTLSPQLSRIIEALARTANGTPFMVLLAAFAALIHRYTGDVDICIGSGTANRPRVEFERLIGMFVNTVALRFDLSGDPTFNELFERVKAASLEAYEHQQAPFDRVVATARATGPRTQQPFMSLMFSAHDAAEPDLSLPDATVTLAQALDNNSAKFDVNVVVIAVATGTTLRWEYNSDLFEAETMARMLDHYLLLLESAAAEPERRISRQSLLTEGERRKLLVEFAGERRPYDRAASIAALFERQAQLTPQAPAIVADDGALRYDELNRRANRLARRLRSAGIEREGRVGVALERGHHLPIALLAILKAGGAYVPLDLSYPRDRLDYIRTDAAVEIVVTTRALADRLPPGVHPLFVDEQADNLATATRSGDDENLPSAANGDSLAYVMYTSGSTGKPKGVAVIHRNVARLVSNSNYLRLTPDDVVLQFAPLSFDASTFEIWGPLLNGATLAFAPPGAHSLATIRATLRARSVSVLWLTAPLFHGVVDTDVKQLAGLRTLLVGGDVVSPAHARRFIETFPHCNLINGYGPTENTTFSCCHPIAATYASKATIPIGRPIANTTAYVLDRHLAPAPIDVPGEIFVGGDGLAREYLNQPELTAERFITDPFGDDAAGRLYRTGDRGRFRSDGSIEFLGRLDDQVKIRGFRVELGEVTGALREHPDISEARVTIHVDASGTKTLAAFAVPRPPAVPTAGDLRAFLRRTLPDHALPATITLVDRLPATPSGKIDTSSLVPVATEPARAASEPQTPTQRTIAEIWSRLLGHETPDIDAAFFETGGHSLLAMRLVARIADAFGVDLSLRWFFDHPTIAELATLVDASPRSERVAEDRILPQR